MRNIEIVGMSGNTGFEDIVKYFIDLGGDVILLDPDMVCGKDHLSSAVMHAERAFRNGTNRSKNILTETILYAAGERQISKALDKMRPKEGCKGMAAIIFDIDTVALDTIGMKRHDELLDPSEEKARNLGVELYEGVSVEDAVLEHVALLDLMKQ
jgi:Uncharacterized conserved protein